MLKRTIPTLLLGLCLFGAVAAYAEAAVGGGHRAPLTVVDLQGKTQEIPAPGAKATVLLFVSTSCPYSIGASPEMARIADKFEGKGVDFLFVYGNPSGTAAATADQAKKFGFDAPVILDTRQVLVRATGATNTPEAFVVTPQGKFVYHGRIDNQFSVGASQRPTEHDLVAALDAVLAGRRPAHSFEQPIGCAIPGAGPNS